MRSYEFTVVRLCMRMSHKVGENDSKDFSNFWHGVRGHMGRKVTEPIF